MIISRCRNVIVALIGAPVVLASIASAQTYRVIQQYKLPGDSARAIALDSSSRRLFVAGDDGITVLNADTGATLGTVSGIRNSEDVLLLPKMNGETPAASEVGYASDASGNVIAFSLRDLKPSSTIKLGAAGPSAICYDGEANTVEAVTRAGLLTTIDPTSNRVLNSRKVAPGEGQVVCGHLGRVYVADPSANVVHVLNHDSAEPDSDFPTRTSNFPTATGNGPTGLALDPKGRRLFVSCNDGTIDIIDTDAGFTFIVLKGGTGAAHGTFAWLPQGKGEWKAAAFMGQTDGTLSGVRMNAFINYTMGGQYKLVPGLGPVAYDEKTHHLFFAATEAGTPTVVVVGY